MANRNTVGFGLISQGALGSTPATQGQGKYYIEANYATSLYNGTAVKQSAGFIITAQANITDTVIGVLNGVFYNAGATFGMSTTTGSTQSGQSSNMMLLAGGDATANTWRTVRIAEDPENSDITAINCSVVVVQNLNQYNNGVTMA